MSATNALAYGPGLTNKLAFVKASPSVKLPITSGAPSGEPRNRLAPLAFLCFRFHAGAGAGWRGRVFARLRQVKNMWFVGMRRSNGVPVGATPNERDLQTKVKTHERSSVLLRRRVGTKFGSGMS
jgi:hypothetical protein